MREPGAQRRAAAPRRPERASTRIEGWLALQVESGAPGSCSLSVRRAAGCACRGLLLRRRRAEVTTWWRPVPYLITAELDPAERDMPRERECSGPGAHRRRSLRGCRLVDQRPLGYRSPSSAVRVS